MVDIKQHKSHLDVLLGHHRMHIMSDTTINSIKNSVCKDCEQAAKELQDKSNNPEYTALVRTLKQQG